MNRVLYFLIAGCVAAVTTLAFFQQRDIGRSSTDVVATAVFFSVLAAATCILIYSRWGRRLRLRLEREAIEEDERVRSDARTKGVVRKPPLGPVP
jgi:hypothetical protein